MQVNLIDLAKGYLTDAVVDQASSFLGESSGATKAGFDRILPAVMGGLMNKGANKSGAEELFGMITKPEMAGGLLNNIGDLFSGSQQSNETMNIGGTVLKGLFGDKLGSIVDIISSGSGMKSGSTSSLMKLAVPMVMSVIGKKVKADGLGLDGFMKLLAGQKDFVAAASPSGFMDKVLGTLGIPALGGVAAGIAQGAGNAKDAVTGTAGKTVDTAKDATKKITSTVTGGNDKKGGGGFGRFLPLLFIVALLAAAAYFLPKGCADDATKGLKDAGKTVVEGVEDGANAVGDAGKAALEAGQEGFDAAGQLAKDGVEVVEGAAGAVYNVGDDMVGKAIMGFEGLGKFVKRKVGDAELIIPQWGVESKLLDFVESNKKVSDDKWEGWMNLDRVLFETGSANLDAQSQAQIDNISAILKANEDVNLKVGGYTDNVGDPANNITLSDNRAKAVMAALVATGVDASRLEAEGYGEAHPVCPANDTDECKAKNRRVAVRVTKK